MFDLNYFKNISVIVFILISTLFFLSVIIYRKYHNIKFRSFTSILMTLFYLLVISLGIYFTYNEVLAEYYYKNGLYKEASYKYMKDEELKKGYFYKILGNLILYHNKNLYLHKTISFYAAKNYHRAIGYLKTIYKNEKNEKNKIFIKLYLAHSYLETGDKRGGKLLIDAYLEALCSLNKEDIAFFENIIRLNPSLSSRTLGVL